jgi:hypothetical protein
MDQRSEENCAYIALLDVALANVVGMQSRATEAMSVAWIPGRLIPAGWDGIDVALNARLMLKLHCIALARVDLLQHRNADRSRCNSARCSRRLGEDLKLERPSDFELGY